MKPALQVKVGQRLSMTPQLAHSIKMLQLSALELRTEIQQALDSNPLLEEDYQDDSHGEATGVDADYDVTSEAGDNKQTDTEREPTTSDQKLEADQLNGDSALDVDLDAQFDPPVAPAATHNASDTTFDFATGKATPISLHEHLLWQVNVTSFSSVDRRIAEVIVNYIGDDGYLSASLEEIHQVLNNDEIELDEVQAVLRRVQNYDPDGVAARDLSECLSLQLRTKAKAAKASSDSDFQVQSINKAQRIVEEHIDDLATQQLDRIARTLSMTEDEIKNAVDLIQSLNPRPGYRIAETAAQYVIPDIIVRRWRGEWRAQLNSAAMPKLKVTNAYDSMFSGTKKSTKKDDREYVRDHINDARWFIKTIHNRNETLLRVATQIVERQQAFFENGEGAMKPMILKDIAEALDLHESTVSRATTQKYMHTPMGVVELKYFFSTSLGSDDGDSHSATAIRSMIRDIVAAEDGKKPVSDSKITNMLKAQNISVARRTVAKYRELLGIPPSNQRKSL